MKLKNTLRKISKFVSLLLSLSLICITCYVLFVNQKMIQENYDRLQNERLMLDREKQVACPSLLSVARTPRDTLIVMKYKSICVEYVFDNLN